MSVEDKARIFNGRVDIMIPRNKALLDVVAERKILRAAGEVIRQVGELSYLCSCHDEQNLLDDIIEAAEDIVAFTVIFAKGFGEEVDPSEVMDDVNWLLSPV